MYMYYVFAYIVFLHTNQVHAYDTTNIATHIQTYMYTYTHNMHVNTCTHIHNKIVCEEHVHLCS